ncbi:hypothetical protein LCAC16_240088 [Leuconostoc carnosum]|nr:hypothetical protein LCAC16_240088 [Leuconostoc carnosum]
MHSAINCPNFNNINFTTITLLSFSDNTKNKEHFLIATNKKIRYAEHTPDFIT